MQNNTPHRPSVQQSVVYSERLTPTLWIFGAALVLVPMTSLSFLPISQTVSLAVGVVAAVTISAILHVFSPVVRVTGGELFAGKAHISLDWLGEPEALTGEQAREARGRLLPATGWHLLRGGIDGVVRVPITDPADPVKVWTISTRTPDRLAAALRAR